MSAIKRKHFLALNDKFQAEFTGSYEAALENDWASSLASKIPVSGRNNVIEMMAENLKIGFESGRGTRVDLKSVGFELEVKRAEGGFELEKIAFKSAAAFEAAAERGTQASAMLGHEAQLFPQSLVLQLMTAGTSATCVDGQPFFSATHYNNFRDSSAGTYSNYSTNMALTADNVAAAIAQIRGRKMPNGTPRNLQPKFLFHSTDLEAAAWAATDAQVITVAGSGANINSRILAKYGIVPVAVPGINAKWWGIATANSAASKVNLPFFIGTLDEFSLTDYSDLTDAELRRRSVLEYTAEGFLQATYGWPYLIHLCVAP